MSGSPIHVCLRSRLLSKRGEELRSAIYVALVVVVAVCWLSNARQAAAQDTQSDPFSDPATGSGTGLASDAPIAVAPPPVDAPVASAATSARRVLLGRSFVLVVRVVHAAGIEVNLPSALKMGAVDELRRTSEKQTNPDGSETREFELEVMAFALGEITIPPIEVTYTGRGSVGRVRTNPIALEIVGVIGEGEGALQDIRPPVDVRRKDYTFLYAAAAVIGTLVGLWLLLALRRFVTRGRVQAAVRIANRVMAPDEEALTRLASLEARGDLEADDLKPAYLEMSDILKSYIGRRFGFPANELTTLEIRNELAARPHGEMAESKIRSWLEEADLVKFANQKASPEDGRGSLEGARAFVQAFAPSTLPTPSLGVVSITDMGGGKPSGQKVAPDVLIGSETDGSVAADAQEADTDGSAQSDAAAADAEQTEPNAVEAEVTDDDALDGAGDTAEQSDQATADRSEPEQGS